MAGHGPAMAMGSSSRQRSAAPNPRRGPMPRRTGIDRDVPAPGETCAWHDDCCQPEDMTCTGCGTPATLVLTFTAARAGKQRMPVCEDHSDDLAAAILELMARQRASQLAG